MDKDPHVVLGLPRGATEEMIRSTFRSLALRFHPDVNPTAETKFREIVAAYNVLTNCGCNTRLVDRYQQRRPHDANTAQSDLSLDFDLSIAVEVAFPSRSRDERVTALRTRLEQLNTSPHPPTLAVWRELVELTVERVQLRKVGWSVVRHHPEGERIYRESCVGTALALLKLRRIQFPLLEPYVAQSLIRRLKRALGERSLEINSSSLGTSRDGTTAEDSFDNVQPWKREPAGAFSPYIREALWQLLRDIRKQAMISYNPKKADWRNHWLPWLYYRAERIANIEDASKVLGIDERSALDLEIYVLNRAGLSLESLDFDIDHPDFVALVRQVVDSTTSKQIDFYLKEWIGLRTNPIERRYEKMPETLDHILAGTQLDTRVKAFENKVVRPVFFANRCGETK